MPDQIPPSADPRERLRLGHIAYSNCFPVHSRLLDLPTRGDPALIEGVPSTLNRMLAEEGIDVSPSSSIEYALHSGHYRILPDLVIGSRGPVRSILLLSNRSPAALEGQTVAIPTASATSVVLLKILLQLRWQAEVRFRWFDQSCEDPFADGAAAALFIGDVALRTDLFPRLNFRFDLGEEWFRETGLPFAFALWQVAAGTPGEIARLHEILLESRAYGEAQRTRLAQRYASHFGMPAEFLASYWNDLSFTLDAAMIEGLQTFYTLAAQIGELEHAPELKWIS